MIIPPRGQDHCHPISRHGLASRLRLVDVCCRSGPRKQTLCRLAVGLGRPKADSLLSEGRQLVACGGGRGKTAGRRPAGAEEAACGVAR